MLRLWEARDVRRSGDFFSLTKGNRNCYGLPSTDSSGFLLRSLWASICFSLMPRILLKKTNLIHAQRSGYSIPLRRKGIEFFWFDGKLDQKSEEKVLKDSMKPSQNSSASVSETWSRTKSNRIFTRLLNVTISLQPYVKILLDYGEMMAALFFEMLMIHQRKSNRSYEN
ncbi:hypothetical protein HID58_086622 [Brassica napus]|uniref:Uncharacterized protein n=1 Tax=Brassica napus TaxID=3708 RepID=A0ABQ7XR12_BRANA|nr:hypothetical protein HID58_086622 [Brassica napus]